MYRGASRSPVRARAAGPRRTHAGGVHAGLSTLDDSFPDLKARLQAKDGSAAREIFERFARRLVALARSRISATLQHKVDAEGAVQSAYRSFFRRYEEGKLEVVSWNSLWGLLTVITLRKCAKQIAYHRSRGRDAGREVAEAGAGALAGPGSREPTPLQAAVLSETVEQLLASLDERDRPVVELSLQGYTTGEISQQLGLVERTVRRVRERVRKRLQDGVLESS
jgi:RNA polymerase sigma-70 factor (ECF subfamily)